MDATKIRLKALVAEYVEQMQSDPEYIAFLNDAYAGFGALKTMADGSVKRIAPQDFLIPPEDHQPAPAADALPAKP